MQTITIALQLYSIRQDCADTSLPAVLEKVAKMGYEGVEFAGFHGMAAAELRRHLNANGLKVAGSHTPIDQLLGDKLSQTIEYNRTIGNGYLIVPSLPEEYRNSAAAWEKTAGLFNEIAEKLAPADMQTGYHNHTIEFTPIDGKTPWDIFFSNTRKDVIMQVDSGNALHGGADVAPFIERYPGRATTIHLKEYSKNNDKAIIGEGEVNWKEIFRLATEVGDCQWYIVEQESYAFPPMECVERCLVNLRQMLAS